MTDGKKHRFVRPRPDRTSWQQRRRIAVMADDFDRALTSPVERVARTLAGHALSKNAEGDLVSAGEAVDRRLARI